MFERFTDDARQVVVQAQAAARRLGHGFIGCEHLLLATASTDTPASLVLRDQGVSPERIETEILRTAGPDRTADLLGGLDREALASIGIELDVVRTRLEAAFGPDALARAAPACRRSRRPAWRKGPLAELIRRRRRGRVSAAPSTGPARRGNTPPFQGPGPGGHIPFTPRA
ncbi:MAG: Clp protease N-terminal domain-containing protein, partial [Streptosporangiaceae bacterium]